jgi:putative endonuclease
MSFFTYILYSEKLDKFYVGHTNNLIRRFHEHNSFQSSSTKSGTPWELVFSKEFYTNSEANKFELKIKSMKSRKYIEEMISNG